MNTGDIKRYSEKNWKKKQAVLTNFKLIRWEELQDESEGRQRGGMQ